MKDIAFKINQPKKNCTLQTVKEFLRHQKSVD